MSYTKNLDQQNTSPLLMQEPTGESNGSEGTSNQGTTPSKHRRLKSLDIVRGFTIALMIFVDDLSNKKDGYPHINHSPWNNIF